MDDLPDPTFLLHQVAENVLAAAFIIARSRWAIERSKASVARTEAWCLRVVGGQPSDDPPAVEAMGRNDIVPTGAIAAAAALD